MRGSRHGHGLCAVADGLAPFKDTPALPPSPHLCAVVMIASTTSMILCKAESVPIVMSVPQKSLSMEPTIPTMWRAEFFWTASSSIRPKGIRRSDRLLSQLVDIIAKGEQEWKLRSSGKNLNTALFWKKLQWFIFILLDVLFSVRNIRW